MTELELTTLENTLESLLQAHTQLQKENIVMQKKIQQMNDKHSRLLQKNINAATQVKQIISQLKEEA